MGAKPALVNPSIVALPHSEHVPLWTTSVCMLLIDFSALASIYWLAVIGRYLVSPGYTFGFYLGLFPAILLFLAAFAVQGLYPGLLLHPAEEIRRVFYCITTVFLLICSSTFLWRNADSYSRSVFLITWASGAPIVLLARWMARSFLSRLSWWGVPAILLGSGSAAGRVARYLQNGKSGIKIAGVLTDDHHLPWDKDLPPITGRLSSGPQFASAGLAHYAIVATAYKSNTELRQTIQDHCTGFRHILLVPDLPGLCSLGICIREIGGEVGFEVPQRLFHRTAGLAKRTLDLILSSFALLILCPLFFSIALAIKVTSRGPVFFGHPRYGRDGEPFRALKFRTMVPDADSVLLEYLREHPDQLAAWQRDYKLKEDPRVTPVGKWLRRYSLDELPQLINVLKGQMSLVGPRPIVTAEIPKYGPGYSLYTRVLPGITGLWQVSGRNNTTYDERVAFDEYYVRNWSIWLDTYILARTLHVVFTAEGAY